MTNRLLQVAQNRLGNTVAVHLLEGLTTHVDARVFQQIVDKPTHAVSPVDGKVDELSGGVVQLVGVSFAYESNVGSDSPERFLEIMGCCICELLQVVVGACQRILGPQDLGVEQGVGHSRVICAATIDMISASFSV